MVSAIARTINFRAECGAIKGFFGAAKPFSVSIYQHMEIRTLLAKLIIILEIDRPQDVVYGIITAAEND